MSDQRLLRALVEALSDPQTFLGIVLDSADRDEAIAALQDRYEWDEQQAAAVLDMQFRRATRAERDLITQELQRTAE